MTDQPAHDAGRQAVQTARIYRERRVDARRQAERQAARDRAVRAERQAEARRGTASAR